MDVLPLSLSAVIYHPMGAPDTPPPDSASADKIGSTLEGGLVPYTAPRVRGRTALKLYDGFRFFDYSPFYRDKLLKVNLAWECRLNSRMKRF